MSESDPVAWEDIFVANMVATRRRLEMSQTNLAKRVAATGVSCHQQTIQRIEAGERAPRLNEVQAITTVLFGGDIRDALTPPNSEARARGLVEQFSLADSQLAQFESDSEQWFWRGRSLEQGIWRALVAYVHACEEEGEEVSEDLRNWAGATMSSWAEVTDRLNPNKDEQLQHTFELADLRDDDGEHPEAE